MNSEDFQGIEIVLYGNSVGGEDIILHLSTITECIPPKVNLDVNYDDVTIWD